MTDQILSDRIVISRNICHGKPRIAGTRIMVYQILDLLAAGKTVADITSDEYFPDLTAQDVFACVEYASHVVKETTIVPVE
jgi:uncharacterized protein (DUF433 family)